MYYLETDKAVKKQIMDWLSTYPDVHNITDTTDEFNRFYPVDITYYSGDTRCGIEVKGRRFNSNKFGDNTIESHKLIECQQLVMKGEYDNIYVFSTFTDGNLFINSIWDTNYKVTHRQGYTTTDYANKRPKELELVNFKPGKTIRIGS